MRIEPYLFFNGCCEEALEYYGQTLGAEVQALLRFKENPSPQHNPPGSADKVMHACVTIGDSIVMASDGMKFDGRPSFQGFSLTYNAVDQADARRRFDALAKDGQVQMPLGPTFFAQSFGSVQDKFGLSWMVIAGAKQ